MNCKRSTKTILSLLMAMAMVLTMMSGTLVFAEPTGSITLQAPSDPNNEGEYVDLGEMNVKAYRVLDEENPQEGVAGSFFTVNADFADFFATASETFYSEANGYIEAGKLVPDKEMYFTYDGDKLVLSSDKPSGSDFIKVYTNQINEVAVGTEKYFAAAVMAAMLERADSDDEADASVANAENTKILAEWLRKYAVKNGVSAIESTASDDSGRDCVKFDGLELGYWLLVSENAPSNVANVETVFKLAAQRGSSEHITAELKLENQEIDKQVKNESHSGEEYGDSTTAEAGDILNYHVEMNIPDLRDYDGSQLPEGMTKDDYKYQVRDTLHNQWLVDEHDEIVSDDVTDFFDNRVFTVTISWLDEDGIEQKLTFKDINSRESGIDVLNDILKTTGGASTYGTYNTETNEQTFILDFDIEKLRSLEMQKGGWREAKLTVEYSAELTSDAVLRNDNDVLLDYSNDPKTTETPVPPSDKTTTYSYGFVLDKTFQKDGDTDFSSGDEGYADLVKDVTFQLFKATGADGNVTSYGPDAIEVVGAAGSYRAADSVDPANEDDELLETEKTDNLKLAEDGSLHVYGLDAGYYVLQETAAPNGYARINQIVVYLDDQGETHLLTGNSKATEGDVILGQEIEESGSGDTLEEYLNFAVRNRKGFNLPTTGGAGVWMLTIGGLLLIALAAAMIISRKRKHIAE